jgi:hypothetical protein
VGQATLIKNVADPINPIRPCRHAIQPSQ